MDGNLIKANLNLYAVLKNLEDLVRYDPEINKAAKNWNISIQFKVRKGPEAYVEFKNGECRVGRGKKKFSSVILYFFSPSHLNKMFDGGGNPIPLRGYTKLKFLTKEFTGLTDKLEYYLKPEPELLKEQFYLELNTRLTLNTAAYAVKEIAELDPAGREVASHIRDGILLIKILPNGPTVNLEVKTGRIQPGLDDVEKSTAVLYLKNVKFANDFLNGNVDTFAAIAAGDALIKGQTPMLDSISLLLDRIPVYLS